MIGEPFLYGFERMKVPANWSEYNQPYGFAVCNRIYVIYGGIGKYLDNGKMIPFKKKHFYLFPSTIPFFAETDPCERIDHMCFDFIFAPPLTSKEIVDINLDDSSPEVDALNGIIKQLEWLVTLPKEETKTAVTVAVSYLMHHLRLMGKIEFINSKRINMALELIHRVNLEGELVLPNNAELAQALHMDIDHFIRLFKKEIGVTPYQYILNHRINVANSLLHSGKTATEAARLTGYESASSMYHAIRRKKNKLQ